MLSEYNSVDDTFHGQTCLVPNLRDKPRYVLHIRNLKLYTDLGMKVDRIHKVIEFDQKAFLVPYIAFNTEKRRMARSSFEKDFFQTNVQCGLRENDRTVTKQSECQVSDKSK